ncbi:hypothetical protein [Pseudomonas sp. CLCA07]
MKSKLKYKAYPLSDVIATEQYQLLKADAAERDLVLRLLKDVFEDQADEGPYDLQGYELKLEAGSSLYKIHTPGRVSWNELADRTIVMAELRHHRVENMVSTRINASGRLEIFRKDTAKWETVDLNIVHESRNYQDLLVIGDIANVAGGYVYTEDLVDVDQWLAFHGLNVPTNATENKNLMAFLEFDPGVDELGNYWGQLVADDPSLAVLPTEHFTSVRQITAKVIAPDKKLLDKLYRETGRVFTTYDNAAERIVQMVNHPVAQACARKYVSELDWFGAQFGQDVSAEDLAQLLITAILLDLNPLIGNAQSRKSIDGFDLYAPDNVERSSAVVRDDLQAFLYTKGWVDPPVAPLASHLLLAEIAPEFLVKGVPSSLMMGSIGWVSFCHGVALAEAVSKGASRVMTYAQIMAYADLEPVSDPLTRLWDLAMIDPIVDWALINGVVTTNELTQAEKDTTERALSAFQEYADNFTHLARAYSSPMPSREDIARAALQWAAPTCDFLDDKVLYQRPGLYASPTAMSMVDLHMSGDLVGGQWDLRAVFPDEHISSTPDLLAGVTNYKRPSQYDPSVVSVYRRYPKLLSLAPNNNEFHRQLRDYFENFNSALVTNVKLALAHMLPYDLEAFLKGKITFFTFRPPVVETSSFFSLSPVPIRDEYETQRGKDAVTGRFGIVICASHGNTVTCYELFALSGELRKNNALGTLIATTGKLQAAARMDFNGNLDAQVLPTPLDSFPVTLKEYTDGVFETYSAGGRAIIEKLGELPAPTIVTMRQQSIYKNFGNPQLARIAEFIVNKHPLRTFDETEAMAIVPTALESERKNGEETATYIVNLVVPFKKCIEDISSGEHNKVVDGVYGCVMDAIALGGAFLGAGVKALSISAKAISLSSKAARLTRLAFVSSVSLFNPVDDVPSVLFGGVKLVHKGALRFNTQARELLGLAKSQLGKLHGRHKTYDLVRATDTAYTGQGTWRPRDAIGDTLTVVAARNNFQWYALNRLGKPWGPKLSHFTFVAPVRLPRSHKTLPLSYTLQFIEQSLPRACTKIDNAINVLTLRDFAAERDLVIKFLMGSNSSDALNRLLNSLRTVRADFGGVSISNFFLDPLRDTDNIAAFDSIAYQQWKDAIGQSDTKFIEIYTPNLNRHFISLGFNHNVVADDLIHELFHGAAQIGDVGYARDAGSDAGDGQLLDVAVLLNLASGRLPVTDEGSACHASSKAFENADSLAVATSLLSQLYMDKGRYDRNMAILQGALEANPDSAIGGPVLITLNNTIVTAPAPAYARRPLGAYVD